MRILQVESDLDAAGAAERLIKAVGSTCDPAPSGRLALELAMFEHYDLILLAFALAFALPDMSGAEVIDKLDAADIGAPVLVRMRQREVAETYADILQRFVGSSQTVPEPPKPAAEKPTIATACVTRS